MTSHPENPLTDTSSTSREQIVGAKDANSKESSIARKRPRLAGKLFYYWSLTAAGLLLLVLGPPSILVSALLRRRHWLYPWALFGAYAWLKLCGMKVVVRGLENLDDDRTYVFIANHRSFLDTATLFYYLGRRIGILAKKELLKVPIMGYGMGFVNVMAIDRSNRERALETVKAATERIRSGVSFGVFAEGTRALPGELKPFKKGAFYMARDAGVPVVPVAMKNTDRLMGKGTGEAWPGTIEMVVMPPIETRDASGDEDIRTLIARVQNSVADELNR